MSGQRLRVAVIIGSVREGRFGPSAAAWFTSRACHRENVELDVIDLAEAWLPGILPGAWPCGAAIGPDLPPAVRDLAPWLAAADAFVIVTPEYNHSFPAVLKNAIDWYRDEWRAKPVAFVSYGDAGGGLRAVEQLRPIFAALEAVTIGEPISFHHRESPPETVAERVLDRLVWWAAALRTARDITAFHDEENTHVRP
ncbi:NAD(P)H-dependent oxidoreductase [Nonomuraea sp. NN258]|uniref:NADPH-dependent FMN reductase n=1 Tax=Nonomuraea antri TaxID=2730852 RepID=UPI0015693940|nr:NAD(P)H-dependent oxidoreductase [Nonomuraea antri]NRQ37362.1 NAD(P)H-dependent oxidoreductase [Nonomuraea antri]